MVGTRSRQGSIVGASTIHRLAAGCAADSDQDAGLAALTTEGNCRARDAAVSLPPLMAADA